ncbi:unnamed protein product [Parnassius apollo]|uniref:(apollo) hypothetical protein n=1 Tax=Parnassius apollo TaxID=110799 RepID=A0A8S3Y2C8_PARAO|nr:unnamed protein product [Parnassius apollo]
MSSLNQKQIEQYLAQINDGERSEDDLEESDGEENEIFYRNREDILRDHENPIEEEKDDDDPILAEDPPLINENPAMIKYLRFHFHKQVKGLVWKVKKFVLNSDQTTFLGNTTYPPELRDQTPTGNPYSIFSYFITSGIIQKIVEESNLYSVQKKCNKTIEYF